MRARRMVGLVLGSFVVAAACAGDEEGGLAPGGGGAVTELLDALPAPSRGADEPVPLVVYGDLATAARLAGVERPDDLDDEEALRRYLLPITGVLVDDGNDDEDDDRRSSAVAVALPGMAETAGLGELEDFAADVGWTVLDVDRFIERRSPPDDVTVLEGRFEVGRLDDAMGEADDGVWVVGDPEGGIDPDDRTPARRLGEPLWLSLSGDRLVVSGSPGDRAPVGGIGGADRTLADDATFAGLARALDGQDVYTALLAPAVGPPVPDAVPEQRRDVCDQALPEAPLGAATGLAHDDGPVLVIALVHEDGDAAQANAEAIERLVTEGSSLTRREPWSEVFTVDDVSSAGNVTVARLRLVGEAHARIWQQLLVTRESLVTAC